MGVFTPAGDAGTLTWTGNTSSLNVINDGANWGGTAPSSTSDLWITSTSSASPNLYFNASLTINSLTFNNNSAGSTFRLGPTNSNSSSVNRVLTFATATSVLTVQNAANVTIAGTYTSSGNTSSGSMNLTLASGNSTINVDTGSTLTFADKAFLSGTGAGVIKTGAGTVQFSTTTNNNTFTGGLQILQGTWGIVTANQLGSSASPNTDAVIINGGTLRILGTSSSGANRGFKVGSNGGTISVDTSQSFTINGTIADVSGQAGSLIKTGAGSLTLSATNSFTGGLQILGGTISVDAAGNLGAAASANTDAVILDGGTLQFTAGTSASSGNRGFRVGSNGGTFDISNGVTTTLNGNVRDYNGGAGVLTKTGAGTLVLNGTSSYTGGTTVSAGTLQGDTGSLIGSIVNNAAVVFAQDSTGDFSGSMSGTGTLTKTGSGELTVSGTLSPSGATTIDAGQLTLAGGTLGGSTVTVSNGATFGGTGTVASATLLAAGASLAATDLTFNSSLDLSAIAGTHAGSLLFTLTTPGASDTASIDGLLSISSGALTLADFSLNTSGLSGPGTFTLFQSSQAISGLLGNAGLTTTVGSYTGTLGLSGDSTAIQFVVTAAPIPEPSTFVALLGATALGFAFYRRARD